MSIASQSCTKIEKTTEKLSIEGERYFLSVEYDPNYFPEEDFELILQTYFDEINQYMEDSNSTIQNYSVSDGIWCLTSALNYTVAVPFGQTKNIEDIEFTINLDLVPDNDNLVEGSDLVNKYLTLRTYLNTLNTEEEEIFLVEFASMSISDNILSVSFNALVGSSISYEEVDLVNSPIGVPESITLKMGLSSGSYQSAPKEAEKRYNKYLWTSINQTITHPINYYHVQKFNPHDVDSWTHYDNCHYQWSNGDWILYIGSSEPLYLSVQVSGVRFNTYLARYFSKRMIPMLNENQSTTQIKSLKLRGHTYWLNGCNNCGYIYPYSHSNVGYVIYQGKVSLMSNPLTTYNL